MPTINVSELKTGDVLYRWSDGNLGRYFSKELIADRAIAADRFALSPQFNQMTYLDEFRVTHDIYGLVGEVAPLFGKSGGASQVFIIKNESILLENVRRIKSTSVQEKCIGPKRF